MRVLSKKFYCGFFFRSFSVPSNFAYLHLLLFSYFLFSSLLLYPLVRDVSSILLWVVPSAVPRVSSPGVPRLPCLLSHLSLLQPRSSHHPLELEPFNYLPLVFRQLHYSSVPIRNPDVILGRERLDSDLETNEADIVIGPLRCGGRRWPWCAVMVFFCFTRTSLHCRMRKATSRLILVAGNGKKNGIPSGITCFTVLPSLLSCRVVVWVSSPTRARIASVLMRVNFRFVLELFLSFTVSSLFLFWPRMFMDAISEKSKALTVCIR